MSKKDELFDEFVQLRVEGKSFQIIAEMLSVSKQTLINWSQEEEVDDQVSTARLSRIQNALSDLNQSKEAQIVFYARLGKKIQDELEKRDVADILTDRLIPILERLESKISELAAPREFKKEVLMPSPYDPKVFVFDPKL